ncbi:hypothetical protein ACET3Z_029916 [Daucus carota]
MLQVPDLISNLKDLTHQHHLNYYKREKRIQESCCQNKDFTSAPGKLHLFISNSTIHRCSGFLIAQEIAVREIQIQNR